MQDVAALVQRGEITVTPVSAPLTGRVQPPGSKSITNRVLLLAALARGTSHITGALKSLDTLLMSKALRAMGVVIDEPDALTFVVRSDGRLRAPGAPLMLGNAGTAMRFLPAAATLVEGPVVLDGDAHMRKRPIGPLVETLRRAGVAIADTDGCPPVRLTSPTPFARSPEFEIDGALSSQYVSALLMLAGALSGPVVVRLTGAEIGARGYVDLTLAAMAAFGATVERRDAQSWCITSSGYHAAEHAVEPDASAATYLWGAAALTEGRIDLGVSEDGFTQPDARARHVIDLFPHLPAVIDGAQMQDAVPTLAVLAAFNATPVRFTGIANLRVKECDRVAALATELDRIRPGLGREDGDDLIVAADPGLAGLLLPTEIETYADHRIAMAFALAGLKIHGITIRDPACTAKTYPEYWRDLAALGVRLN